MNVPSSFEGETNSELCANCFDRRRGSHSEICGECSALLETSTAQLSASKKSAAAPIPTAHPAPWFVCPDFPWMIVDRRGRRIADFMAGSFSREWAIENARAAVAAYNAAAEREERETLEDETLAAEREQ